MELCSVLCGSLDGWGVWGRMDTCICRTESLHCSPETITILLISCQFSSAQFSRSVVSDSLWPHEPQHARPPCPSPTPGVHPNPCPLCRWIQPSHRLSSPSPPASNLSQHQGLFKWVSSPHTPIQNKKFKRKGQIIAGFTWCIIKLIPSLNLLLHVYTIYVSIYIYIYIYIYTHTHTNRDKALTQNFFKIQARFCHQHSMTCK